MNVCDLAVWCNITLKRSTSPQCSTDKHHPHAQTYMVVKWDPKRTETSFHNHHHRHFYSNNHTNDNNARKHLHTKRQYSRCIDRSTMCVRYAITHSWYSFVLGLANEYTIFDEIFKS